MSSLEVQAEIVPPRQPQPKLLHGFKGVQNGLLKKSGNAFIEPFFGVFGDGPSFCREMMYLLVSRKAIVRVSQTFHFY